MIEKIQLKSMDDIEKRSISSPSLTLEQMLIKIGRLDSMKSTPAIHHHPQTAKNFLGEFARFYNVGVVFDETPVKSNHEYQNPIISIESTKSKFQKPKRRGLLIFFRLFSLNSMIFSMFFLKNRRNFFDSRYTTTS